MIPESLLAYAARGPEWVAWLEALPRLIRELLDEWELTLDGEPAHGHTAWAAPVRTTSGRPAMLKVGWPHPEAEHEALALQHWRGNGAVQLLRADPHRWALLLERLHREDLTELWDVQACEIVGGFYRQLHVPAPPQLRLLSSKAAEWAGQLAEVPRDLPIPHRMVEQARSLARDFASDEATDGRLIHTDLHYENVLAADRADWLVIDPKPLSGDPHYEVAPMLWNRWSDYTAPGLSVRDGVRNRFFAIVDAAELDEDRARDWVVVRMVVNVVDELLENGTPDHDWVTACISIAKAVQG